MNVKYKVIVSIIIHIFIGLVSVTAASQTSEKRYIETVQDTAQYGKEIGM